MPHYNVLIGCDQTYYDDWGIHLVRSIKHFNPWITCHVHIVNPVHIERVEGVQYSTEERKFKNNSAKLGYLQCVRFLKVAEKFNDNDMVMTLDADTICTRQTTPRQFAEASRHKITMLRHLKAKHWLAGLVTFGTPGFRQELADKLLEKPIEDWVPFWDQTVLKQLSEKYTYHEQPPKLYWMSIGKNGNQSVFLTLKGNQKEKDKYLDTYKKFIVRN
tara:strand:- start:34 stop:684 length:651 start_codon:yes stop_codon:yes gene_type:complete